MAVYSTKTNRNKNRSNMLKLGWSLIGVFSLLFLTVAFNFFDIISIIILGSIGLLFYPLCLFLIFIGIMFVANKPIKVTKSIIAFSISWLVIFVMIMQMITSRGIDLGFSEYMSITFKEHITAGGVLFSVLLYPFYYLTHTVATYVILSCILVVISAFLIDKIRTFVIARSTFAVDDSNIENKVANNDINDEVYEELAVESDYVPSKTNDLIDNDIFIADEEDEDELDSTRNDAMKKLGLRPERTIQDLEKVVELSNISEDEEVLSSNTISSFENVQETKSAKPNIIVHEDDLGININNFVYENKTSDKVVNEISEKEKKEEERKRAALEFLEISKGKFKTSKDMPKGVDNVKDDRPTKVAPVINTNVPRPIPTQSSQGFSSINSSSTTNTSQVINSQKPELFNPNRPLDVSQNGFEKKSYLDSTSDKDEFLESLNANRQNGGHSILMPSNVNVTGKANFVPEKAKERYNGDVNENIVAPEKNANRQISIDDPIISKPKPIKIPKPYKRPPIDLLIKHDSQVNVDHDLLNENAQNIVSTLKSFKIDTEVLNIVQGPTFTCYEMKMMPGIPVNTIFSKENDLKMVLKSDKIRLQVPIPGKNAFGIEVPNAKRTMVGLRDIIESDAFKNSSSPLTIALGKDIYNNCKVHQIDKMIHTLVAGGTGSGKSVCLHTLLVSMLYKASPDELKLLLVDPKRVELGFYNRLPHMLIPEAINDIDKAIKALEWLVKEMERRYTRLQSIFAKNIIAYNNSPEVKSGQLEKMYYIVMVFDEVGDFMIQAKKEIEDNIKRLAAMSRACGIHLILTTQKPTQEVITGTIKTNLPSRIAFAVTSNIDSRVILDTVGAETLLGKGDMLFLPQGGQTERMQCAFVDDDKELKTILNYIRDNNEADFDETIEDEMFNKKDSFDIGNGAEDVTDPLVKDCMRLFIKKKKASAGSIQSFFSVGWPRASKIMAQLEKLNYVSSGDNKNNRTILMSVQEFEEIFGESIDD